MAFNSLWPKVDPLQGMSSASMRYLDSLGFFGWQLGLERIRALCAFFGNPQDRYPCVHLAGTNGKGSTAAMLAAIGQAAGMKTGLYTSPHLVHLRERIQINGRPVAGEELEGLVAKSRPLIDKLRATYFEALTAIAFVYFAEQQVDWAVIETGLGGRLDATNVIVPEVSIITSIGLEHQQYLGTTLGKIAQEKAGILKSGRPCVSGVKSQSAQNAITAQGRRVGAVVLHAPECAKISAITLATTASTFRLHSTDLDFDYPHLALNLPGRHQIGNARLAVIASHLLRERGVKISQKAIRQGLAEVRWPTRMQLLDTLPAILIDAAHNPEGMRTLARGIQELFPHQRPRVVMGLLQDKSPVRVLRAWQHLRPEFFFVRLATDRAMPPELLAQAGRRFRFKSEVHSASHRGMRAAIKKTAGRGLIVVAGSHYLLGELMAEGYLPYPYAS
jgi:dihydrofolate synthase/folylpolyglutamate synthase